MSTVGMGSDVRRIVRKALGGGRLRMAEVRGLLAVDDPAAARSLFEGAEELRSAYFGRSVFLYGFVYFSTFCGNRCTFCFYRRGNRESPRYRKSEDEVVRIACGLAASGVHLVDLTMGEDPSFHETGDFAGLVELVGRVRHEAGLPVMVSPGIVSQEVLTELGGAGAEWYACYQETHNPGLFRSLRPDQDYATREASRSRALALGLHAEDGILLGVGETVDDRTRSLLTMRAQGVQQVRAMAFVPQRGTPMSRRCPPTLLVEMVTLATMRLLMPERLIPASLDIDGLRGLEARLRAGANVVTSIIPPAAGLVGVSQAILDIDQGLRTVAGVERLLAPMGLEVAAPMEYEDWLVRSSPGAAVGPGERGVRGLRGGKPELGSGPPRSKKSVS